MNNSNDLNDEYLCQKYVYAFRCQYDRAICLRVEKLLTVEKGAALVKLFPHVCSKCNLRFASNVDLTAHTERHRIAGNNAFCECCGNIYSSLDYLLRHESSEHVGKNLLSGGDGQVEIIEENHAIFASSNINTHQAVGFTKFVKHESNISTNAQNFPQQHQFREILSPTINESVIDEKKLDVEPWQESSNDEDDTYFSTCSSIENAEQEEENSSDPDLEVKVIPKIPGKRGPKIKSEAENPRTCPDCGKRFAFPSIMQQHRVVHSKTKVFTCNYCKTSYKKKNDLKQHIVTNHHTISDWQYNCSECGMIFPSTITLRRHHVFFHTDPKTWSFQCRFCDKSFVTRGELNQHMRKHVNERPFACDVCFMCFKQKSHLANHIRSMKHEQLTNVDTDDDESNENDAGEVVVEN